MRRFTSRPKPGVARARVHVGDVGAVDAQPVAHAVVAREVRRRLGRRDEVVRGEPVHRRRHRDPLGLRARVGQRARRRLDRGLHVGLDALGVGELLDDADPQALDAALELVEQRRRGRGDRRGVARVVPADHLEQQRGVGDRRRERTDLVERRRERDRARSATPRRRSASRRPHRRAPRAGGPSRRCRSRARAARTRPRPRPPIRRSIRPAPASRSCGLRVGPNAEFSVELPIANSSRLVLPTVDRARVAHALHDGRVVRRPPALEDPRRARGRDAARAEVVLQRDRHAGERTGIVTARDRRVDLVGARPRVVGEHEVERVHVGSRAPTICARCSSSTSRRAAAPGAHVGRDRRRRRRSRRLTEDARHAEPAAFGRGRRRQHLVARQARARRRRPGTR